MLKGKLNETAETERTLIASLNVGTMKKSMEIVETVERRSIDIYCLQETRWRHPGSARMLKGKEAKYKFHWCGNDKGAGGVGILTSEKWVSSIFEVNRPSYRIIQLRLS